MSGLRTELISGLIKSVTAVAKRAKQASTPEEHKDAHRIETIKFLHLAHQISAEQLEEVVSEFDLEFQEAYRDEQDQIWEEAEQHLSSIYTTYMEDALKGISNPEDMSEQTAQELGEYFNTVCTSLSLNASDRIIFESALMYGFCTNISKWLQSIRKDETGTDTKSTLLSLQACALPFNIKKIGSKQFKTFGGLMNILCIYPSSRNERVEQEFVNVEMECAKYQALISFISNISNK